ncbi:MAG: hypothetical protein GY803_17460 [Chloroflexi bacterium]|nr:hypothetical protein [Chloroflexota bacterium]
MTNLTSIWQKPTDFLKGHRVVALLALLLVSSALPASVSGDTVDIGSYQDGDNGTHSDSAYDWDDNLFWWDGGGGDNNWSTASNWKNDAVPDETTVVHFVDGGSSKDAVIDSGFSGAVAGVIIGDKYAGSISFARSLAVKGDFSQDGGTVIVDPAHTFTVDGDFVHTGGTLQESQTVGSGTIVNFLQIRDSDNTTDKYRGVDLDTNDSGSDLGSVTVSVKAVDRLAREYCTNDGSDSPLYADRCFTITPANNNQSANVSFWTLTSEIAPGHEWPGAYHYNGGSWRELANIKHGTIDSYTWVSGKTTGFSMFLIAQKTIGEGEAPTAVTLQTVFASTNNTALMAVMMMVVGVLTAALLIRRKQS